MAERAPETEIRLGIWALGSGRRRDRTKERRDVSGGSIGMSKFAPAVALETQHWLPHNGHSHNRRGPLKGFRPDYNARRQTARAAFSPAGEMRRRNPGPPRRDLVRFRGLLDGATAGERRRSDRLAVVAIRSSRLAEASERRRRRDLPARDGLGLRIAPGLRRISPAHTKSLDERASSRRPSSTRKPQTQSPRRRAPARRRQPRSQARPNPIFDRF